MNIQCGIRVKEVRIVPDIEKIIIKNVLDCPNNTIMSLPQEGLDQHMTTLPLKQSQKLLG